MSSAQQLVPDLDVALKDAILTLKYAKKEPGKKEKAFDKVANAISKADVSPSLAFLNDFYTTNSALISNATAGFASLDNKTIDATITGFSETVKVVMNGLDALGTVHPFVGVAVAAFKLVVTLDLTRRVNNQKILAYVSSFVRLHRQPLHGLRRIGDPEEIGPDGTVLKDRMQPLMEQIARDIKECGSACDVYLKKTFIAKMLKSKIYEGRLAGYTPKFMDYRDQLDKALTVHIALGVDAANVKLDSQSSQLDSIEEKLDMLTNVFRCLDTPHEKEESGGPNAIIERNDLVLALVDKSGENLSNLSDKARSGGKSELDSVREKLQKEVTEDLDVVLKQNFVLFDRKLEIQSRNIVDAVEKQGQYIVSALSAGAHDRIGDTFSAKTPLSGDLIIQPGSKPVLHIDNWALQYINVAHLSTILEAIDDDGTGFINIKEANTFANEHPKGWGLLPWIAFWAKGWETSPADYKNRIIMILQEMDRLHHDTLAENQRLVDLYLSDSTILSTHLVLKSTKAERKYSDSVAPELLSTTREYTKVEEDRLDQNLGNIGYDLDSPGTVMLIAGRGRIERVILKRDLEVFRYACRSIVDDDEFTHMTTSLRSIFGVVRQRIDNLRDRYIWTSTHLESFALGIFHDHNFHNFDAGYTYNYGPEQSLFMTWRNSSPSKDEATGYESRDAPKTAKPLLTSHFPGQIDVVDELME
ncbi:hypothetical protein D9756_010780 [Leucocoprinus leucothites]|uniref:EF-hand domain-containing protein n=1 Tax=Leucocoprinus leucothites TaxID=201217 RepID=A0A8H5CWZ3_9AGAR|nr:hypothetical protein D9756_010780 [Leucoagaricus leucothites]